jgi:ribosomal protein S18 acetylase RimI-like enzyme
LSPHPNLALVPYRVRLAATGDLADAGRLLDAFNREYDDPTPGPEAIAERLRVLIEEDTDLLLAGDGPDALAVLRYRRSLWTPGREAYLAELYVRPPLRGQGLGRALMERAIALAQERGADGMDLNTSVDDTAARGLYESLGFTNLEGPGGPSMLFYELNWSEIS